jgi:8-oxo-dGTP pyrophosphatase MutT (NUDIX family)
MTSKNDKSRVIVLGSMDGRSVSHVLIIKTYKPNSMYYFPGGALEEGESFLDAAVRELHEELGIYLPKLNLMRIDKKIIERNVDLEPEHRQSYREVYYYTIVDVYDTIPENVDREGEIADYKWATINESMMLLYPRYSLMLQEVLSNMSRM